MGNRLSVITTPSTDGTAPDVPSVTSRIRHSGLMARLGSSGEKGKNPTTPTGSGSANKRKEIIHDSVVLSLAIPPPPIEPLPITKESSPVFKSGPSWRDNSNYFYDDDLSPGIPSPPVDLDVTFYNSVIAKEWVPTSIDTDDVTADNRSSNSDMRDYYPIGRSNYILPVDKDEQIRLEFQHYMLKHAFNGDILCQDIKPILKIGGAKVLDVGCAQGAWLHSVDASYPNVHYFGVDIAADAIKNARKANNITLTVGNVLEGLPYPDNTFDYVHQRNVLALGIKKIQCVRVIRELIRVAKPGAWIELVECDSVGKNLGPIGTALGNPVTTAIKDRGFDLYSGTNLMEYVEAQGLRATNIDLKTVSIPLNWGEGTIGRTHALSTRTALLALEDLMHQVLRITREEYKKLVNDAYEEWAESKSFIS